jgi:hypothetical protein
VKLAVITARHIVDPQWAGCSVANPTTLLARVNIKEYVAGGTKAGVVFLQLLLIQNGQKLFLTHTDDTIDAVVIPISVPEKIAENDVGWINLSDFLSKEEIEKSNVGIGDAIVSAGLVPYFANEKRNYAAFKFGKISNVFDQPIEKNRCGPQSQPRSTRTWLIAGNFVGGNSGSPIFLLPLEFTLGKGLTYNGPRVGLLGLLSASIEGADLAEMTPVEYILEIIKAYYPDADLFRGDVTPKPQPEKK